jgi:hypothetical protein
MVQNKKTCSLDSNPKSAVVGEASNGRLKQLKSGKQLKKDTEPAMR